MDSYSQSKNPSNWLTRLRDKAKSIGDAAQLGMQNAWSGAYLTPAELMQYHFAPPDQRERWTQSLPPSEKARYQDLKRSGLSPEDLMRELRRYSPYYRSRRLRNPRRK